MDSKGRHQWCSAQRIKILMIASGNHTFVSAHTGAKNSPVDCFLARGRIHEILDTPGTGADGISSFVASARWGAHRHRLDGGNSLIQSNPSSSAKTLENESFQGFFVFLFIPF